MRGSALAFMLARLAEFVIDLGESASSVDDFEAKLQELRSLLGGIKILPIMAFGNLFFHQWLNEWDWGLEVRYNQKAMAVIFSIKALWQWWKKIWQENGAAASGPFCQRLLEQLGQISFHHDETLLRTLVFPETLRLIQKLGGPQKPGQADAKGPILGVFSV